MAISVQKAKAISDRQPVQKGVSSWLQTRNTLEDREVIAKGIENGSTKASLGRVLGKDSSAIAKEIRKHRERYRKGRYPTQCRLFSRCPRKKTCQDLACSDYAPFYCPRRL